MGRNIFLSKEWFDIFKSELDEKIIAISFNYFNFSEKFCLFFYFIFQIL